MQRGAATATMSLVLSTVIRSDAGTWGSGRSSSEYTCRECITNLVASCQHLHAPVKHHAEGEQLQQQRRRHLRQRARECLAQHERLDLQFLVSRDLLKLSTFVAGRFGSSSLEIKTGSGQWWTSLKFKTMTVMIISATSLHISLGRTKNCFIN